MGRRAAVMVTIVLAGLVAAPEAAGGGGCHAINDEITAGRGFEGSRVPIEGFKGASVPMEDCAFTPTILYVEEGTEVAWLNMDLAPHTVTGAQLSWGSTDHIPTHSGETAKGIVTHRFDDPGVYPYYCILHPGMAGAVVVGDVEASKAVAEPIALAAAPVDAPASRPAAESSAGPWPGWLVVAFAAGLALALGTRRAFQNDA